jgi:hypothetical protein
VQEQFLQKQNIDVAEIERVYDKKGTAFTHGSNTNTNYNQAAKQKKKVINQAFYLIRR